jgi:DeoR family fructose operon transcriptional repressor
LKRRGALRRVHGGAISAASRGYLPPYSVREKREIEAKKRIGEAAAAMIGERETVILDVGTTTLETARALRGRRNLTVINREPAHRQRPGQGAWNPLDGHWRQGDPW